MRKYKISRIEADRVDMKLTPEEWPEAQRRAEHVMAAACSRVDSILRGNGDIVVVNRYRQYDWLTAVFGPLPEDYKEYEEWYDSRHGKRAETHDW